jgi:dienelactone hydrolase
MFRPLVLALAVVGLTGCAGSMPSDDLQGVLRPHDALYRPQREGKSPAVVLLHGCYGVRGKEGRWAARLRDEGYVALVVDSMTGRGLTTRESLRSVCSGLHLWGSTRAPDVAASLAHLRTLPFVDADRIAVIGWSHGAWTVLDFLATASPADVRGLRAVVAFYPYCGLASRARWSGLGGGVPVLMLLAGQDAIVSPGACLGVAEAESRKGHPVTTKLYAEAGHAFDWRESAATQDARERVREFLNMFVAGTASPARAVGDLRPAGSGSAPQGPSR